MPKAKENYCSGRYAWILGIIFLILAWLLWVGSMSLERVIAIVLIIWGIIKIWTSFQK